MGERNRKITFSDTQIHTSIPRGMFVHFDFPFESVPFTSHLLYHGFTLDIPQQGDCINFNFVYDPLLKDIPRLFASAALEGMTLAYSGNLEILCRQFESVVNVSSPIVGPATQDNVNRRNWYARAELTCDPVAVIQAGTMGGLVAMKHRGADLSRFLLQSWNVRPYDPEGKAPYKITALPMPN